jgi:anti-sigma B factor antagonist
MEGHMEIEEMAVGRTTVLAIKGRIDSNNAIDLSNRLRALYTTRGRLLLLDCKEIDYITSAGFRTLLIGRRHATSSGGAFALCCLTDKVRDLFEMGGFMENFTIHPTREEGIARLA